MLSEDIFSFGDPNDTESEQRLDLNSFLSGGSEKQGSKSPKKNKTKKSRERVLKVILTVFLVCVITFSIVVGTFLMYVFTMVDGTMDENLNDLKLNFTTTIYIDDGKGNTQEYQRLHGTFNRIWIPYDRTAAETGDESYTGIPQNLVNSFVAIEDKRFFSHKGVDWKRTVSAFANLFLKFNSANYGGSTITQQLVKNLTGDNSRKPSRKIREIMRARYFETHYAKDTIVECYLNTIAMGHGTYGVEVAANYYFGKSASQLTLAECATLAAITKSPTYFAPDDYPEANRRRMEAVLSELKKQKYITDEEYQAALAEEVKIIADPEVLKQNDMNSYFVDALIDQVVGDLVKTYGYEKKHAENMFYTAGYRIYATLDPSIQEKIETAFADTHSFGLKAKDGQTLQGSMTVMDYSGHVLAMVGGIGEKTSVRGFNRATSAIRQPGSTMKPLSAYAPAIENDLIHYSSLVNDTATNYNGWKPVNWYNSYFGNVTVEYALERSINTIPVYLVNKMTPQFSFDFLTQKLGITTLNAEDVNLSPLGMGGTNGGITTLESAAAFAVFGNGGLYYEPTLYSKVTGQNGETVLSPKTEPVMAISEDAACIMNHLLRNVVYGDKGTGKDAAGFVPQMKIYAKTGTSNDQKDLWFVGGSPYYISSCWCGYDSQQDIAQSSIALRLWGAAMSKVHAGLEPKTFSDSSYVVQRYYCTETGGLATDNCPSKALGWYKKNVLPSTCKSHSGNVIAAPTKEELQKMEEPKTEEKETSSSAQ